DVLAIYPHAHYLGKQIEAWATLPDGRRQWLIRIPDWDINWQAVYEYQRPVFLPKGTQIAMRIFYDNSEANPRNPNHPPRTVISGNRSEDEMGHVWLQLLARNQAAAADDPRYAIQEAVMRRRLEKYPDDFLAHYNLAALFQFRGKLDEAIASYRDALRVDPSSVTAQNSLGAALLAADRIPEAIPEFRQVLNADPNYTNARYNLAHALALSGDLPAAAAEYATLLKQEPDDASAHAALGTIYFKQRTYSAALTEFRAAANLDPHDADIEANLGTLLAITGDLPAAIQAFETALRLDPTHEAARANLARAHAQLAAAKK
ncbi:MAG TPA: tetratricopeptide repeat protein, partial [Terriglobia bacterium]|nr:tetratricopeptide repeat protein [Terriglobia bacterium]